LPVPKKIFFSLLMRISYRIYLSLLLFWSALLLCYGLMAQTNTASIRGRIINHFINEPIPFASVYWKINKRGVVSDSSGNFIIPKSPVKNDTLVISYIGFEDLLHPFNVAKDTGFLLLSLPQLKMAHSVEVKTKFNKGLRWWRAIVAHKAENNPYQYNNYSYELYNKLELDINNINRKSFEEIKVLKPFAFVLNNIDSLSEAKPFLPIFLSETISDYFYSITPHKAREEIKAVQTSGIKNETVMQFLGGITQRINVYEDYMHLFGQEFISPVSKLGDKFYNYKGADTQIIYKEKYFHLFFSPKQEGSNTFSGDCWIHAATWAVQRVNLNISITANVNFVKKLSIVQEFAKDTSGKWVFAKDKFIAHLSPFKKEKISFTGRKTSIYKNIQINQSSIINKLSQNKQTDEIIVKEEANQPNNNYFNNNRFEALSMNESKVYTMIDTLKQIPLFKKYSDNFEFIFDGHKKLGLIEIGPWFKWFSGNQLEKVRVRFDIGTTKKLSEHLLLNAYLAYGFKDGVFKGKAALNYKVNRHESWQIGASYTNDLDNGRIKYNDDDDATVDNLFSQLIRRQNITQKFLGIEEYKVSITKDLPYNFSTQLSFNRNNYRTFGPLPSQILFSPGGDNDVINSEISFKVRFTPGEKQIVTHRKTMHIKNITMPVAEIKYSIALPNLFKSEYSYQRITASYTQSFRLPRWGKIDGMIYGGKYFGDSIPFMMLEIHPGNEIYYYNKQSFNLMNRFEYFSDAYAGFNMEYNFEKKIINLFPFLRKTKMRQFVNVKTVWGDLNIANRTFNKLEFGSYRLKRLRGDNYTEIGTGIDNIFKYFRLDLVWRIDPKFTPPPGTIPNNPQKFGIFGSFRLQF